MALTAGRWFTVITLVDQGGQKTSRRYEQSDPADDAAARVSALALVTDLIAVTDSVVESYYTYQEFSNDAFALPAAAQNENQALLIFDIVGYPMKRASISIPAPKIGIFTAATGPNSNVVDIADVDLVAFAANWLLDDLFYLSDGEVADSLLSGHRRHIKNTRG